MPLVDPRLAGTTLSFVLPVVAGRRWDAYSARRHYISELGALTATRPASRGLLQRALEALLLGWAVSVMVEA